MAVPDVDFKQVLSSWATGVTVVTTSHAGQVYGLTVSSFSSLSISPQLVLVCIMKSNNLEQMVRESQGFGISVLAEGQDAISNQFAVSGRDPVESYEATTIAATGSPLFDGALAHIDCTLHEVIDGGDHVILLGEPVYTHYDGSLKPLMFYQRAYRSLVLD